MAWEGSDRAARLPKDWHRIRRTVMHRDGHRCTVIENGERCTAMADEVDHVQRGDDHRLANLAAVCAWHHARKSSAEGNAARWAAAKRNSEPHPGLID